MKKLIVIFCLVFSLLIGVSTVSAYSPYLIVSGGGVEGDDESFSMETGGIFNVPGRDHLWGFGFIYVNSGQNVPSKNYVDCSSSGWYTDPIFEKDGEGKIIQGTGTGGVTRREQFQKELDADTLIDRGVTSSSEFGIFATYGLEILEDTNLFAIIFGGVTWVDDTRLYETTTTSGIDFIEIEGGNSWGMYGFGLSWFPEKDGMCFQIAHDNRRGYTGGIGYYAAF